VSAATGSTRAERLVDRWADLTRWPTAKKTAFAMSLALLFHLVVPTLAVLAFARWSPGLLDLPLLTKMFAAWIFVIVGIIAVALPVARSGREGRWTFYLLLFGYGTCAVVAVALVGTATSPWFAIVPLMTLLVPIFFDRRAGRDTFTFVLVAFTVLSWFELSGHLSLAPAMQGRTLEAMRSPGWYLGVYILVFSVLTYVFLLVQLSVSARDIQQMRLEAAHRALAETSTELTRANETISRYVAGHLAQKIRAGEYADVGKHERRKLTLFFSDIKDFTTMSDRLEPEDLSALLNEYLSEMSAIAHRHGGMIDKFVGDAIMILFGAPVAMNDRDQAIRAVRMAMEMQSRLVTLREKWLREGLETAVEIRIGINTGQATIGTFGSPERMDYTAIGRQVNLAARLQAHCEPGRILVSHSTYALIRDDIACVSRGEIRVKGFEHPLRVYEIVSEAVAGSDGPEPAP
jgi:class 3 adenylate cyclase